MDEVLTWAETMDFDSVHFNLMHDPWEFSIVNTPNSAQSVLMLYLQKCQVKWAKYAQDIHSIKELVMHSRTQDAQGLHTKLRLTDLYRNQNFAESHAKMAKVIGYEL